MEFLNQEEYRKKLAERKNNIIRYLEKGVDHFINFHSDSPISKNLSLLTEEVKNGNFTIVVVGEFSAGKSTFLNALMGEKFLPSYSNETTATINFLKHKEHCEDNKNLKVYLSNGNIETFDEVSFDILQKYSTANKESGIDVVKEVNKIELFLESKFLSDKVLLVDSPGLNGIADGHRDITESQIEKSHSCIYIFSADHPGTKSEFEFIERLNKRFSSIIFVLNKIDIINTAEGDTVDGVIAKLKSNYKKVFPDAQIPEIYPIAAKEALIGRDEKLEFSHKGLSQETITDDIRMNFINNSKIEFFENRLWSFLTNGEKTKNELIEPLSKLTGIYLDRINSLKETINDLNGNNDTEDLEREIELLKDECNKIKIEVSNQKSEISENVSELMELMIQDIKAQASELRGKIAQQVESLLNDEASEDSIEDIVDRLKQKVKAQFSDLLYEAQNDFYRKIKDVTKKYGEVANEELNNLKKSSEDENIGFDFSVNNINFEFGLKEYEKTISEKKKEAIELEKEIERLKLENLEAMEKENKLDEKQLELKQIEDRYYKSIDLLGRKPDIGKFHSTQSFKESRDGLFGFIGNILIGKKTVYKEVVSEDHSAIENFEKEKSNIEKKYNEKQECTVNELQELKKDINISSLRLKAELELMQQKESKIISDIKEEMEEKSREYKKKARRLVSTIKYSLSDDIDNARKMTVKLLENNLYKQQENLTRIIMFTIESNLIPQLEEKIKRIETREKLLKTSTDNKNTIIKNSENEIVKLQILLDEVMDFKYELENIKTDTIKYE
jgi:small GTP-binding protein